MFDQILSRLHLLAGKVHVRNALSPLLWLSAVIGIPLIVAATIEEGVLSYLLFGLLALIVLFVMLQYNELRKANPRYLQSEEYQLRRYQLENLGDENQDLLPSELEDKQNRRGATNLIEQEGVTDEKE